MSTRVKCFGCGKRIPASESELVLRRDGSEKKRYFHQRCLGEVQRVVISDPAVWHLTNRYLTGELN